MGRRIEINIIPHLLSSPSALKNKVDAIISLTSVVFQSLKISSKISLVDFHWHIVSKFSPINEIFFLAFLETKNLRNYRMFLSDTEIF